MKPSGTWQLAEMRVYSLVPPALDRPYLRAVVSLHVFDMDGTLLEGTTASLQIARHHGPWEDFVELEARFASARTSVRAASDPW